MSADSIDFHRWPTSMDIVDRRRRPWEFLDLFGISWICQDTWQGGGNKGHDVFRATEASSTACLLAISWLLCIEFSSV